MCVWGWCEVCARHINALGRVCWPCVEEKNYFQICPTSNWLSIRPLFDWNDDVIGYFNFIFLILLLLSVLFMMCLFCSIDSFIRFDFNVFSFSFSILFFICYLFVYVCCAWLTWIFVAPLATFWANTLRDRIMLQSYTRPFMPSSASMNWILLSKKWQLNCITVSAFVRMFTCGTI